jgi:hypothetical protein
LFFHVLYSFPHFHQNLQKIMTINKATIAWLKVVKWHISHRGPLGFKSRMPWPLPSFKIQIDIVGESDSLQNEIAGRSMQHFVLSRHTQKPNWLIYQTAGKQCAHTTSRFPPPLQLFHPKMASDGYVPLQMEVLTTCNVQSWIELCVKYVRKRKLRANFIKTGLSTSKGTKSGLVVVLRQV